jgi:hypothetical protein
MRGDNNETNRVVPNNGADNGTNFMLEFGPVPYQCFCNYRLTDLNDISTVEAAVAAVYVAKVRCQVSERMKSPSGAVRLWGYNIFSKIPTHDSRCTGKYMS